LVHHWHIAERIIASCYIVSPSQRNTGRNSEKRDEPQCRSCCLASRPPLGTHASSQPEESCLTPRLHYSPSLCDASQTAVPRQVAPAMGSILPAHPPNPWTISQPASSSPSSGSGPRHRTKGTTVASFVPRKWGRSTWVLAALEPPEQLPSPPGSAGAQYQPCQRIDQE
jgi:hypothetical protein